MSRVVFACGLPRRRDRLDGLSDLMRAALADAATASAGRLHLYRGSYTSAERLGVAWHAPATLRALAERGLMQISAGPLGRDSGYRLTRRGHVYAAEIQRRVEASARWEKAS